MIPRARTKDGSPLDVADLAHTSQYFYAEIMTQLLNNFYTRGTSDNLPLAGGCALGNRSILADPRPPDMKDRINLRVKFREEFRPFAPSILDEFGDEYFESYQVSPYMERTLTFKESA